MTYATLPIKYFKEHPDTGLRVEIEESTEFCARITSRKGTHMIIGADLGVNSSSSSRVSDDKLYSYYFLKKDGLNIIDSVPIYDKSSFEHINFDYPFVLKPNTGLGGDGFLVVSSENELDDAYEFAKSYSDIVVAQKYIRKREYRIVTFLGRVYFAYERTRFTIIGDGSHSIKEFIEARNKTHKPTQQIDPNDFRMLFELRKNHLTPDHVPLEGEEVFPFANANLKCGGKWRDVTACIHEQYKTIATQCANSLGLTIAGVDLFAESLETYDPNYTVIEVNSSPGFEYIRSDEDTLKHLFRDIVDFIK